MRIKFDENNDNDIKIGIIICRKWIGQLNKQQTDNGCFGSNTGMRDF